MTDKTSLRIKVGVILVFSSMFAAFLINVLDGRLSDESDFVRVDHVKLVILSTLIVNWIIAVALSWRMEKKGGW